MLSLCKIHLYGGSKTLGVTCVSFYSPHREIMGSDTTRHWVSAQCSKGVCCATARHPSEGILGMLFNNSSFFFLAPLSNYYFFPSAKKCVCNVISRICCHFHKRTDIALGRTRHEGAKEWVDKEITNKEVYRTSLTLVRTPVTQCFNPPVQKRIED